MIVVQKMQSQCKIFIIYTDFLIKYSPLIQLSRNIFQHLGLFCVKACVISLENILWYYNTSEQNFSTLMDFGLVFFVKNAIL